MSSLNIIQAICGGRPGTSGQLEGPSVFLLVPMGGLKSLFRTLVSPKVHVPQGTASTEYRVHSSAAIPMGDYDM